MRALREGRVQLDGRIIMNHDYLAAAGVFAGAAAMIAVILAWLGVLQSECLHGSPVLAAIFPCFR